MNLETEVPSAELDAGAKAAVLAEALPYIRRFWGKVVVVKYGGNAIEDQEGLTLLAQDVALMRSVGMRPVVVHGGGPQIGELMARLGKVAEFRNGLRVTDAETLDIARMVLVGKVNRDIVGAINVHGPLAVGLSGEDAGLILVAPHDPDLGFVGEIQAVNPTILQRLLAQELIPVVATIGSDEAGQAYNVNADAVAGAVAEALEAEKLVYLTNVEGVRRDRDDPATLMSTVSTDELEELMADGTVADGMIPKVVSCIGAVRAGVGHAHVLDGRVPHALLLEVFTREGVGTMVSR
ncbi:MAG TPA: acetylglutamate kinase [Acidimicrobiales bacterium]|nr:acetylglutamate kinase [Acidimicrobiales bacterium]